MTPGSSPSDRAGARGTRAWRPAWAWTPDGLVRGPEIAVDAQGRLVEPRGEPVRDLPGLVVPGFVNAHVHLELGPIPWREPAGLVPWVRALRAGAPPSAARAGAGLVAVIEAGAAAVGEITNTGLSLPAMRAAGLPGRAWHEVLGVDVPALPDTVAPPTPHGPHSTHPAVIRACAAGGGPWSMHFDEDPEEAAFLRGEGAWPAVMRALGRDLAGFEFPGVSPARYLDALGVLGPRALLVHATCTRGDDLDLLAERGARVALCVRSNRAITGRLPDVPGLVARGVDLAVGTDSLASAPDLDVLAEACALRGAFPSIPPEVWIDALTRGGADAVGLPMGRLEIGTAPGVLWVGVEGDDPLAALFDGTPWPRRWLACPQV